MAQCVAKPTAIAIRMMLNGEGNYFNRAPVRACVHE